MIIKQQKLTNETKLLVKWKERGLKRNLKFVKLGLTAMLCAIGFSISAQQTSLQAAIDSTSLNGTIKIGSYTWFVVKRTTDTSGINYTFLISKSYIVTGTYFDNGGGIDYGNSTVRTAINADYTNNPASYGELPAIAVVPVLGAFDDQNVSSTPTATMAGAQTTDIIFAPSYDEIIKWAPSGGVPQGIGPPVTTNYSTRFWTRTNTGNSKTVWEANVVGGALVAMSANGSLYNAIAGVWVRTSPLYVTISGTVKGLPDNSGVQISHTVGGIAQTSVTTTAGGAYSISQVPYGSNVTITPEDILGYEWYVSPTPDINNVKTDITGKDITYYIPGFTVNGDNYKDVDGKGFCNNTFTFSADQNIPAEIVWTVDGTEIPSSGNQYTFTQTLQNGYHTIVMSIPALGKTYATHLYVGEFSVIWTPDSNSSGSDDDKRNWNIAANWTPTVVPTSCDTVYIPGNLAYYPMLEDANPATCRVIYFLYGAELGRPDLLTYQRAFVQYNFGLSQSSQTVNTSQSLVLENGSTGDRMVYSASVSATPMIRERWYMLSAPLKSVVTGDLDFGGFPLTFLKKFGPVDKGDIQYPVGVWTTSYNNMNELVSPTGTEGFAFYMYGYQTGGSAEDNLGCTESGTFGSSYNEDDYMLNRDGQDYGIKYTDGILELPFFEDSTNLYAHRTQMYNQPTSTFFYINDGIHFPSEVNKLTGTTETVIREANDGNYRFAPESYVGGSWVFQNPIIHPATDLNAGDEFLVGNPYMSSIDMVEFCKDNASVEPLFRIWNGDDFDDYSVDTATGEVTLTNIETSPYIAPLQGFFLKYTGSGNGNVSFDVTKISTVRQTTAFNLRSSQNAGEKNLLRIKADNGSAVSHAVIAYKDGASNGYNSHEDVQKLFSPFNYVPSIYSLADEMPVDINFINNNGDIIIPLGIKTGQTGNIQLTFTGMDNYSKAAKIELIDALENKTTDLTGKSSYTCSFNDTETGIQNGRFSLRISSSITSMPDVNSADNLNIYGNSKGIYVISSEPVQQLEVYDLTGKKLYESNTDARYYPLYDYSDNFPLIIKVMTKNMVKTVKTN